MGNVSDRRRVKSLPGFFAYRSGCSPIAPIMDNSLSFNAPPVFFICVPLKINLVFKALPHIFSFLSSAFLCFHWKYLVNLMALLYLGPIPQPRQNCGFRQKAKQGKNRPERSGEI